MRLSKVDAVLLSLFGALSSGDEARNRAKAAKRGSAAEFQADIDYNVWAHPFLDKISRSNLNCVFAAVIAPLEWDVSGRSVRASGNQSGRPAGAKAALRPSWITLRQRPNMAPSRSELVFAAVALSAGVVVFAATVVA
jgi:hypothetical protein